MSTLWTPSGEHPVDRGGSGGPAGPPGAGQPPPPPSGPSGPTDSTGGPGGSAGPSGRAGGSAGPSGPAGTGGGPEAEQLEQLRRELAEAPVEVVVANHCYGLFELAAVYLSQQPEPLLEQARLAIDALGCLVEGLQGRLGEPEATLRDGLAQVRMAFVQLDGARRAAAANGQTAPAGSSGSAGGGGEPAGG